MTMNRKRPQANIVFLETVQVLIASVYIISVQVVAAQIVSARTERARASTYEFNITNDEDIAWKINGISSLLFHENLNLGETTTIKQSDLGEIITTVGSIFVTTTPDKANLWSIYSWNKSSVSAEAYQRNYCDYRCIGEQVIGTRGMDTKCPEVECNKCYCIKPLCEFYNLCCPDVNQPDFSNTTHITTTEYYNNEQAYLNLTNNRTASDENMNFNSTKFKNKFSNYVTESFVIESRPKVGCMGFSQEKTVLYIRSCSSKFPVLGDEASLCEKDATEDVRVDSKIPVVDVHTNVTYYNKYCALCNGVQKHLPWNISSISCVHYMRVYSATTADELLRQAVQVGSTCSLERVPPDGTATLECNPLWYSSQVVDRCNSTGLWPEFDEDVARNCEMVTGFLDRVTDRPMHPIMNINTKVLYKNIFCAICNKDSYPEYRDNCYPTTSKYPLLPFSLLLKFRAAPTAAGVVVITCKDTEWQSPDGHCLKLHCFPGKVLVNRTCKSALERISGLGYHLRLWYSARIENVSGGPYDNVSLLSAREITTRFHNLILEKLKPLISLYKLRSGAVINVSTMSDDNTSLKNGNLSMYNDVGWLPTQDMNVTTGDTLTDTFKDIYNQHDFPIPDLFWIRGYIVAFQNYTRDEFEHILVDRLLTDDIVASVNKDVNVIFTLANMWHDFDPDNFCTDVKRADPGIKCYHDPNKHVNVSWRKDFDAILDLFLNCTKLLNCPYVSFDLSQYRIQNKLTAYPPTVLVTININGTEMIISTESDLRKVAVDKTGKLNVCRELLDEKLPLRRSRVGLEVGSLWTVQYVLTLVCVSVSMACLLLALVTYAIFPVLRNLAGINNICLCFSLLLAQASNIAVAHLEVSSVVCVMSGIISHFLWLCMLCWTLICCFHMFRVFTSKTRTIYTTPGFIKQHFIKRGTFSLVVPTVIVVSVVVTMQVLSDGDDVAYGENNCFLNSVYLVAASMLTPLILVTLLNLTFFIVTVVHIRRVRVIQKQSSFKSNDLRDLYVYIKLSSMTGGFWLVFVMAEGLDSDPLRIIAIILNGLQGVFIFVSYSCNKRILSLYLTRLGIKKPETFHSSSVTETNSL